MNSNSSYSNHNSTNHNSIGISSSNNIIKSNTVDLENSNNNFDDSNPSCRNYLNYSGRNTSGSNFNQSPPTPPTTPQQSNTLNTARFNLNGSAFYIKESNSSCSTNVNGSENINVNEHSTLSAPHLNYRCSTSVPCKYGFDNNPLTANLSNSRMEAYMHHIVSLGPPQPGPPPTSSSHHPASNYSHFHSEAGSGPTPSPWSRFMDSHALYNSPASSGHELVGASSVVKESALQDFYRTYSTSNSECHNRRSSNGLSTSSAFVDPNEATSSYCTKAALTTAASSGLLATMQGCTMFGHDPFATSDSLPNRSVSQLDSNTSCSYPSTHSALGHFLPPPR